MSRVITLCAAASLLLVCAGCGDSFESLQAEHMAATKKLVATLDGVKDAESAKKAKPELKALITKLNDIGARVEKLEPKPSDAQIEAVSKKYGTEMEELQKKMMGNMMRIAFDPKIQAELGDLDADIKKPVN